MRRLCALGAVFALIMANPCAGDTFIPFEDHATVAVPAGSPLRFESFDTEQYDAKFSGQVVISGIYNIRYEPAADGQAGYFGAWFNPDARFVKRLPYWREYARSRPHDVEIENAEAFVAAVLSPAQQNRLKHGKRHLVRGRAAIKIDGFHMNVTCDQPIYVTHFLSLESPAQKIARSGHATQEGC